VQTGASGLQAKDSGLSRMRGRTAVECRPSFCEDSFFFVQRLVEGETRASRCWNPLHCKRSERSRTNPSTVRAFVQNQADAWQAEEAPRHQPGPIQARDIVRPYAG